MEIMGVGFLPSAARLRVGARFGATSDPNSDSEDVPEGSAGVERIVFEPMDGWKYC